MSSAPTQSTPDYNDDAPLDLAPPIREVEPAGAEWSGRIDNIASIAPYTPHDRQPNHWRRFAWRLEFQFWRGLEAVVRAVVLRERYHRIEERRFDERSSETAGDEPWKRQLSVGHGCSGPDLATTSISAINMGPDRNEAETPIAVGVVGSGEIASRLIDCLLQLGVRVHATAETVEDYVAVRRTGAVPHRFEDMPAVAADIDLLISTSFSRFVGATVVARLPESTVIVDLAEAPGSVDFETSRRLGHEPIWAPSSLNKFDQSWNAIRTLVEEAAARRHK